MAWASLSISQALGKPKNITLSDGSHLVGDVIAFDASGCTIQTELLGRITVPLEHITKSPQLKQNRLPSGARSKVEPEMMALQCKEKLRGAPKLHKEKSS